MKNAIWANKSLMILVSILIVGFILVLPLMLLWAESLNGFSSSSDEQMIMLLVGVGCIISAIMIIFVFAPNAYSRIVFSEKKLEIISPFKKKIVKDYEQFKYIYKAYYLSYRVPNYFIVLSEKSLDSHLLSSINKIDTSAEIIKIIYNKGNYDCLINFLPENFVLILKENFEKF
ncbi:MAG: hypothetical protein IJ306_06815 [Oscillospiraceae bacterium]|nr:hypothetical protein [Oscillospiraceae bacterium]